jgi:nicotinate-nucleotide pyrophosphorylase (carboxylating)
VIPPLDRALYEDIVRRALAEDVGTGDVTTGAIVPAAERGRGVFLVKAPCVLAGLDVAFEAFQQLEPGVRTAAHARDGDRCQPGDRIAEIVGSTQTLLVGERTALNFLQRLSGIATMARQFVDAAGGRITILDTRKTTPTLRVLEKYAVRAGGATNHRTGLYDAILIKENHIHAACGVKPAIERARRHQPDMPIEIEAETIDEVEQALAAGAEAILLDNMSTADIREAVRRTGGRARLEISGGVTLDRIQQLATTGADCVSVGALTHSAPAIDISFDIERIE